MLPRTRHPTCPFWRGTECAQVLGRTHACVIPRADVGREQKEAFAKPIRTYHTSFDHVNYQYLRFCSSRFSSDATSSSTATPPLIFLQPSSPVFHRFFSSSLPPVSLLQSSSSSHPPVLLLQLSSNSPLPVFLLLQLSSSSPTSSSFIFLPSEEARFRVLISSQTNPENRKRHKRHGKNVRQKLNTLEKHPAP